MGRYNVKIILISVCISFLSCSFDQNNLRPILNLKGNYFLADNPSYSNDGLMIVYTKNNEFYEIISSNCTAFYRNDSTILFSKRTYLESNEIEYYYLKVDSIQTNNPVLISRNTFFKQIQKLEEVKIPISMHN